MKDRTNEKIGLLTVIEFSHRENKQYYWKCKCECGNETIVRASHLVEGHTKSCGCLIGKSNHKRFLKHGMSNSDIYNVWKNMKRRCFTKTNKAFKYYGSRGINIYEPWINSFDEFYKYVSKLPHFGDEGYSFDRINNDGNYEPNNLRWATQKEQCNNKRQRKRRNLINEKIHN